MEAGLCNTAQHVILQPKRNQNASVLSMVEHWLGLETPFKIHVLIFGGEYIYIYIYIVY